jgi:hypothetical protein
MDTGRMEEDPAGRRIAALAARSDASIAAHIHEYSRLLTRLVISAEQMLLDQSSAPDRIEVDLEADFARLRELKRNMGRSTVAALAEVLPFSMNDYWELSELRERLSRNVASKKDKSR